MGWNHVTLWMLVKLPRKGSNISEVTKHILRFHIYRFQAHDKQNPACIIMKEVTMYILLYHKQKNVAVSKENTKQVVYYPQIWLSP